MAKEPTWRDELRHYLAATCIDGARISLGEVYDLFGVNIPLHEASRFWCNHRNKHLGTAVRMRTALLTSVLLQARIVFDPSPTAQSPASRTTMLVIGMDDCQVCNKPYLKSRTNRSGCCSVKCGNIRKRMVLPDLAAKYGIAQPMAPE